MTLIFNDPIAAQLYIKEFGPKSIKPVVPYLWTTKKPETEYGEDFAAFAADSEIRQLEIDELVPELIDSDLKHIRVDPAIYVKGYAPQAGGATGGVLLMSHDQESGSVDYWSNTMLLVLSDDSSLTKLINQLTIEGDYVFNEPKA